MVEAIDPLMSGTFQALHSYCFEDVVWNSNANFHPCITLNKHRKLQIDLDRFHDVDMPFPSGDGDSHQHSVRIHDSFLDSTMLREESIVPKVSSADE